MIQVHILSLARRMRLVRHGWMTIDKVGSTTNGCGWRVVTSSPKMVDEMLLLYERPET
jgi:hypothetical protein